MIHLLDTSDVVLTREQRLRQQADAAIVRRAKRKAEGRCIDEPDRGPKHGEVHKGGRCRACYEASR